MAVTSIADITAKIKRRIDYNITDSDLDTLLLDIINDSVKELKQLFYDYELYKQISATTTLTLVQDQAYVDISSNPSDLDEIFKLSDRTDDKVIEIIDYSEFIRLYPDPTANKSTYPNHAALWADRIYFGPTPSAAGTVYIEYIKAMNNLTSSNNLPYSIKYDPLIIAMVRHEWLLYFDPENRTAIKTAEEAKNKLIKKLIILATKNIGKNQQVRSRNEIDGIYPNPQPYEG